MTREEVRAAIVNLDPNENRVRLPAWFDDVRWDRIDYLGWRDLRAPKRAYLVTEADDQALGVLLRQTPSDARLGNRAVMCDLCRSVRRFNEVSLFTARRPSRDKRERLNALGLHLCTDLDCAVEINPKSLRRYAAPDQDGITAHRDGIRTRTAAFIQSVAEAQRSTTRHRT
ncbi:FBP domain-containing protein [Kitasatospora sp. NPDC057940]|uniref:FBP domain-containing protein n=1 Tax=Kitasatospora sp. NPDC057940 TaxID=3346285 RepID=UPI0036DA2890